jgi:hypothetical protein
MEGLQARTGQIQAPPHPEPSLTCSIVRFLKGHRPDRPGAHALFILAAFGNGTEQPAIPQTYRYWQSRPVVIPITSH